MRDYANAPDHVRNFYRENRAKQTLEFVFSRKAEYYRLNRMRLGAWEMLERLDGLRDESDPDTALSQMQHALQAAEAARRAGMPGWFNLTALIHDLGKALALFGEPQWAVVGDTFPVGCQFSIRNIFHEFFAYNPDADVVRFRTLEGIYEYGCGLDALHFSWGHDEYLYQVMRQHLPPEALAVIRYHSAYAVHSEHAYRHFLNAHDEKMLSWVRKFQQFDLYSKDTTPVDIAAVRPYYTDLIARHLPVTLAW